MTPFFDGLMRALALVAFLLLLVLSACAAVPQGPVITPEVMAACKAEGGCVLFSRARLEQVLQEAVTETCKGSI